MTRRSTSFGYIEENIFMPWPVVRPLSLLNMKIWKVSWAQVVFVVFDSNMRLAECLHFRPSGERHYVSSQQFAICNHNARSATLTILWGVTLRRWANSCRRFERSQCFCLQNQAVCFFLDYLTLNWSAIRSIDKSGITQKLKMYV